MTSSSYGGVQSQSSQSNDWQLVVAYFAEAATKVASEVEGCHTTSLQDQCLLQQYQELVSRCIFSIVFRGSGSISFLSLPRWYLGILLVPSSGIVLVFLQAHTAMGPKVVK